MKLLKALWALAFFAAGAGLISRMGAPPALGCQTHDCDPNFVCISPMGMGVECNYEGGVLAGQPPVTIAGYTTSVTDIPTVGGGTEIVWDTSSLDGPWLDYPANQTYIIDFPPGLAGHLPTLTAVSVSADNPEEAGASHSNFINGGDYLVEFLNLTAYQAIVHNPSCAHYSLRLEFRADVPPSEASVVDASSAPDATIALDATANFADAGSADAAVDASSADN